MILPSTQEATSGPARYDTRIQEFKNSGVRSQESRSQKFRGCRMGRRLPGLWFVIHHFHAMKNHARAKLRLSRGRRANPAQTEPRPTRSFQQFLQPSLKTAKVLRARVSSQIFTRARPWSAPDS